MLESSFQGTTPESQVMVYTFPQLFFDKRLVGFGA